MCSVVGTLSYVRPKIPASAFFLFHFVRFDRRSVAARGVWQKRARGGDTGDENRVDGGGEFTGAHSCGEGTGGGGECARGGAGGEFSEG